MYNGSKTQSWENKIMSIYLIVRIDRRADKTHSYNIIKHVGKDYYRSWLTKLEGWIL